MSSKTGGAKQGHTAQPKVKAQAAAFSFEDLQKDPQFAVYAGISIIGLILLVLFIAFLSRKGKKRRSVLICGPCDSGKTVLFSQLVHRKPVETYTSMQENLGILDPPGKKPLSVVDIPGHERIRYKSLDKNKDSARAVIYVIDASTITKGIRDATEYLFRVLSDPAIHSNKTPVLIACNKQDLTLAKGATVIERELAKEIGLLRETHSKNLEGTDGNAAVDHVFLGKIGKDFAFSDLQAKVDFIEVSAMSDDDNHFDEIQRWLASIA